MRPKTKSIVMLFCVIFILIFFITVSKYSQRKDTGKDKGECDCCNKKEGFAMVGSIPRNTRGIVSSRIHPIRRKIKASFENPSIDNYYNKLGQIFR